MSIENVLHDLGLPGSKAAVYLAALQTGTARAEDIARKASLPRTTTHEILSSLVARGFVGMTTKGRTHWYTAERPTKLKTLLRERERKLDAILPELLSLYRTPGVRPRVLFYEGIDGVKAVFEDTLTVKEKYLRSILSIADLYKTPGRTYMDDYVRRRVESAIQLRVIRSVTREVGETWPTRARELRELRYAPKNLTFPMTIFLYDSKVGIIGTEKENFGMIIESRDFYETQKNLFDTLWEVSRIVGEKRSED